MIQNQFITFLLLASLAILGGCASTSAVHEDGAQRMIRVENTDPLEKINRPILKFNFAVDRYVLKPTAKAYGKVVPRPVRNGIRNFFSNLWEPVTIVNDVLQGKFRKAGRDTSRFVINSTLGLLGINDVATHLDLPKEREDFGQTLAVWGVPPGPYLVLPFFGPRNFRDAAGWVPQTVWADPVTLLDSPEGSIASLLRIVDGREGLLGLDELLEVQPDKYIFLRENYWERRKSQIYDGKVPVDPEQDTEEDLMDQLLD